MFKKILIASAVLVASTNVALAAAPYVGAGLGINNATSHDNYTGSYRSAPLNVLAGFGGIINDAFYLAGELDVTLAAAEISGDDNALKSTYGYGVSVIPGLMLSDHTLGFARAGFVRSRFSGADETRTGGQVGLGLQTSVTQNVDIRGEYDYTIYQSVNYDGRSVAPQVDAFNLSLIYKFD